MNNFVCVCVCHVSRFWRAIFLLNIITPITNVMLFLEAFMPNRCIEREFMSFGFVQSPNVENKCKEDREGKRIRHKIMWFYVIESQIKFCRLYANFFYFRLLPFGVVTVVVIADFFCPRSFWFYSNFIFRLMLFRSSCTFVVVVISFQLYVLIVL